MNYKVLISFDNEYQGYVAEVPKLPGCMSQGKTIDEAIENIKDAIQGWLYVENINGKVFIPDESPMFLAEVHI